MCADPPDGPPDGDGMMAVMAGDAEAGEFAGAGGKVEGRL